MLACILEHAENVEMGNILRSEYSCHGCVCPRLYPGPRPHSRPWEGKLRLGTNPLLLSAFWFGRNPAVRMQLCSSQLFIVPANV